MIRIATGVSAARPGAANASSSHVGAAVTGVTAVAAGSRGRSLGARIAAATEPQEQCQCQCQTDPPERVSSHL
ncbi:Hypothetical protein A7982_08183 [Minicystis rosea]|nr:Hypothetical protein A7982_08183 [Minicystis rosea]